MSVGLSFWLLRFTPCPFTDFDVCCLGEVCVGGMFVAEINCLAKGLIFEAGLLGVWLDCDVSCDCADGDEELFKLFGDRCGVVCPQGNDVPGDESVVSAVLLCSPSGCRCDVGIGLNSELGLPANFGDDLEFI